jgi:uncharacterized protein
MTALAVLSALAGALAWLLSPELHWAPRLWQAVLLAPLPALMVVQARQLAGLEDLPRRAAYASSIFSLWLLAAATGVVAFVGGIDAVDLGLAATSVTHMAGWTVLLTVAGVAVLFAFRFAGVRETPLTEQLLPVDGGDRAWFAGVSITAGITEEIIFRGFLMYTLTLSTGSAWMALALSSGVFGVVHAYQKPAGALRAGLLGAVLAVPLLVDGTILPSILAHALIDLLSGLWLARYLLR